MTLEDAAEELVVKLKGLDGEIEESRTALVQLRERVDDAAEDVEREWTALTRAASSLLEKVREEQDQLTQQMEETVRAASEAELAALNDGGEVATEAAGGQGQIEALTQHAVALDPSLETLVAEAGEAPARSLADRAAEVERELDRLEQETRTFLEDEVGSALEQLAQDVRTRGERLRQSLAEEATTSLQEAFDAWESKVDELEAFVATQAFAASHQNAGEYVEWAVDECREAFDGQLDALRQLGDVLEGQLQEMAVEVKRSADTLVEQSGAALLADLDETNQALTEALQALAGVKTLLASYSFVQV